MFRLRNNLFFLLCAIFFMSCGFTDLRMIEFSVEPSESGSVLSGHNSPVTVSFNTEMEKNSENVLQVISDNGVMKGDLLWDGNNLHFIPVPGWTAGIRYTLSLSGTVRSIDGRDLRVAHFVSFYAVNSNDPPALENHYPADGGSTGTGDIVLEYHFSRPMDRISTESALTIEGIGNKTFEWLSEDKILKVIPDKTLSPWVSYRWNLRETAKSSDGVPLVKTYSGYFTTDIDRILPRVTSVFPVLNSGGSWYPTGANIETGLASEQGIAVEFNKPLGDNALRSVRIEPSLTGRTEYLSEKSVVYIFTRDPEPENTYTLIVSADTKDREGLKTGGEYRINFTPDIPFLNILSFSTGVSSNFSNIPPDMTIPVQIESGTDKISFYIRFSLPFTTEEKQNAAQKIIFTPFFPRTLTPVALQYVSWINDDRIHMEWEGLTKSETGVPHYYKLTIPGGKSGVTNGMGMYLKEDITIFLEAVNEK